MPQDKVELARKWQGREEGAPRICPLFICIYTGFQNSGCRDGYFLFATVLQVLRSFF
jgi:hypothetical protein